ncbi:hypothetical protein [Flavilitoribacter nigricans]|uniref:Uncharacterized protein n=1 Tax=Flavilitoribacter nigricans (strain ATCC 23147 / DSM 23189 / NBRC 102662 / NCIMB 1420 / SS-2) TaxID=1122177 RepID=A0A2D0N4I1_FLAN2|nr:hypothetical protein [Flavilitoribacter nigricans]PHN03395.1 hypothetical protein CRP01_27310 [Flavilitoribacter nigricans DSM 23189 = NBRC 102662]
MKTHHVNLLNGIILIVIGLWAYASTTAETSTALIPVAFGGLFVITVPPFRSGNPLTANILTLLSGLLIIALLLSLWSTIRDRSGIPVFHLIVMLISSSVAFVFLIRHRRQKV